MMDNMEQAVRDLKYNVIERDGKWFAVNQEVPGEVALSATDRMGALQEAFHKLKVL